MTKPFVRVALVNYGKEPVTLIVETEDALALEFQLLRTNTNAKTPETVEKMFEAAKRHSLTVPGGAIGGFASNAQVKITNASDVHVAVVSVNDKDPWPKPPPPAPSADLNAGGDYAERFANFLLTDATTRLVPNKAQPPPSEAKRRPTVTIVVPARAQ